MKLKENSIVKLISKESLLHVVKNVQILSLGYVKHVLYKNHTVWTTHNVKHLIINLNKLYKLSKYTCQGQLYSLKNTLIDDFYWNLPLLGVKLSQSLVHFATT